jgi:hypothetical protein
MNSQTLVRILACIALVSTSAVTASSQDDKRKAPRPSQERIAYQPINVKTGLWQTTLVYKRSGGLPVPAGMLDSLTPEQRARLESRMSAAPADTKTETHKHCITKEELESPIDFSDKNCTWKIEESTSAGASGNVSCDTSGLSLSGKGTFEALDQEHIQGSEHLTATGSGNPMTVDGTFTSTWLGASCGDVR